MYKRQTHKIPVVAVLNPGRLPLAPHEHVKALAAMQAPVVSVEVKAEMCIRDRGCPCFSYMAKRKQGSMTAIIAIDARLVPVLSLKMCIRDRSGTIR